MKSLSGRAARAAATASIVLGLSLIARQADAEGNVAPQSSGDAGQATTGPIGFIGFEMRYPDENRDSVPATVSFAQIDVARAINRLVNRNVTPHDTPHDTPQWTIAPEGLSDGDCKTFALTKRRDLRLQGLPDGAVRLVVISTPRLPEQHMVLELRTITGIYVLDSLVNDSGTAFYAAAAMPASYTVLKYQTWGSPEHWLAPAVPTSQYGAGVQGSTY